MYVNRIFLVPLLILALLIAGSSVLAQSETRAGTTGADFLQLGFNSAGNAMGEAQVAMAQGLSSLYWNPAALAKMKQNEIQFTYLPWILDINSAYVGAGYVHPVLGSFAVTYFQTGYGEEDVTTVHRQEGTGEVFDGRDASFALSYGRELAQWFSFGATAKYVTSRIWHENASAMAFDLGAIVNTWFFSRTGKPGDGLDIGMSISNYGTRLQYDGIDLKEIVDIEPDKAGNYAFAPVRFETSSWELPLIARIGIAVHPVVTFHHRVSVTTDFIHANNNNEYVNVGGQYTATLPAFGKFTLRAGYKGFNMADTQYGMTFGCGFQVYHLDNRALKMDYAYRSVGLLGDMHTYSIGFLF